MYYVLDIVLSDVELHNMAGLRISNFVNLPDKPIGLWKDQLSLDVLVAMIEKVRQSHAKFYATNTLSTKVDHVQMPVGHICISTQEHLSLKLKVKLIA